LALALAYCLWRYLRRLEDRTMKRLLPVARPSQDALDAMPREIFKSQVLWVT
jgi:hypothetical protein